MSLPDASVPVPLDVAELVVRRLRVLVAGRPEPVVVGLAVATDVGGSADGGPPSLPWLLVAEDAHTWTWPALQRAVIRLSCWHTTEHAAKAVCAIAIGLLCAPTLGGGLLLRAEPIAAPIGGIDPYTDAPLATAAVAVFARTPEHP